MFLLLFDKNNAPTKQTNKFGIENGEEKRPDFIFKFVFKQFLLSFSPTSSQ
jgi:hypothetical protein